MSRSKNLGSRKPLPPTRVLRPDLASAVSDLSYWFVIGGQAVRCLCPYRPSRDVDFGVRDAKGLSDLQAQLARTGSVEVIETSADAVHLRWNSTDVSVFVLPPLAPFAEGRRLGVVGLLATKLHAILDRGTRRDFFDLYVLLEQQRLGIAECLRAIREVHGSEANEALLLRGLTYFADAEREAPLSGEGRKDWATVKAFFLERVGSLLVPPAHALEIQSNVVDVAPEPRRRRKPARRQAPSTRLIPSRARRPH